MGKREKRPFLVEKVVGERWEEVIDETGNKWATDSTASALKLIKGSQSPGTYRVIQECAQVDLVVEQVAKLI